MISFLTTSCGPGGVQSIQISLIKCLYQRNIICKVCDTKKGWVYNQLKKENIYFQFIELNSTRSKRDYSSYLDEKDLLILFNGNFFENINLFSNCNCKILFWEVFYPWIDKFVYSKSFPFRKLAKREELKILKLLTKKKAIYFIDYLGKIKVEERVQEKISSDHFLPIPIQLPQNTQISYSKENINICYVGRSVIWKINPFIKVLKDIIKNGYCEKIHINIVCDNSLYFKKIINQSLNLSLFNFDFYENLSSFEMEKLLLKNHLSFAMGTAALDSAKLGIPTILIDASYEEMPEDYRYRWIYETDNLLLGKILSLSDNEFLGKMHLKDIFAILELDFRTISKCCYNYVYCNYNINEVVKKILKYENDGNLRINEFKNIFIFRYNRFLRKLYFK